MKELEIIVSGVTGTGKSTVVQEIATHLRNLGFDVATDDVDQPDPPHPAWAAKQELRIASLSANAKIIVRTHQVSRSGKTLELSPRPGGPRKTFSD